MTVVEVKRQFLDYFTRRGYRPAESAPLVIPQLPTAFVMSVGLLQLKAVLTSHSDDRRFPPFCMVQRCIRHFDIERVGSANRLSFFEMAGAINSGDIEQSDVLRSIWTFLTNDLGLGPNRLVFSVFAGGRYFNKDIPEDATSCRTLTGLGVPHGHLLYRGPDTNLFGTIDREESCGPTVEIFYDRGPQDSCTDPTRCQPSCLCQRYAEIGTCVFLQFLKHNGYLLDLPRTYSEAAIGVERLAFASSGLSSIYDLPHFAEVRDVLLSRLLPDRAASQAPHQANICTDHLRALFFAVADGARPGRGGRAYLLRKLVRRILARIDLSQDELEKHLSFAVDLIAARNSSSGQSRVGTAHIVRDVLVAELDLYRKGIKQRRIDPTRYLREDAT